MMKGMIFKMNQKGFTLVELLGTIIILGIVAGITIVSMNINLDKTKEKAEEAFISTISDALEIYLDTDATTLSFTSCSCFLQKKYSRASLEVSQINLQTVVNSSMKPITSNDLKNPYNEEQCSLNTVVKIYRDSDYVYYYEINKSSMNCLKNKTGFISNIGKKVNASGGDCTC